MHRVSGRSYENLRHWRRYSELYPPELSGTSGVVEQWWPWRGFDVHLDRLEAPGARFTAVVVHGAGGYGRMLAPFAKLIGGTRAEVVAPDLPGYGLTRTGAPVDYGMWAACIADLVEAEQQRSGRPVVLFGASMGGMVAYDVAATVGAAGLVVTCLLDPRNAAVRKAAARTSVLGAVAPAILRRLGVADRVRLPIRWVVDMAAMSNDPRLNDVVTSDPSGGGNRVSLRFLRTFMTSQPAVEPERFTACPVLLTHPAADRWTPVDVTAPFFDRIAAPKEMVLLDNAGHLPVEQPGLSQLGETVERFFDAL